MGLGLGLGLGGLYSGLLGALLTGNDGFLKAGSSLLALLLATWSLPWCR